MHKNKVDERLTKAKGGEGRMWSDCLMITELLFGRTKVLEIESSDD